MPRTKRVGTRRRPFSLTARSYREVSFMRIIGALAMSLLCSTAGLATTASARTPAQEHFGYQQVQYGGDQDRRNDNGDRDRADRDRYDDRNGDRNDERNGRREQRWAAGDRVTNEYLGREYVIGDWNRSGLSRPPRGHEWIRVGDEYMLVRVEDQKIAKVIFGDPRRPR